MKIMYISYYVYSHQLLKIYIQASKFHESNMSRPDTDMTPFLAAIIIVICMHFVTQVMIAAQQGIFFNSK